MLHVLVFDEQFGSLQSWARPFELADWYNNNETIIHICFATGTEDVLLVDSSAQARIYSFVSQRFRYVSAYQERGSFVAHHSLLDQHP